METLPSEILIKHIFPHALRATTETPMGCKWFETTNKPDAEAPVHSTMSYKTMTALKHTCRRFWDIIEDERFDSKINALALKASDLCTNDPYKQTHIKRKTINANFIKSLMGTLGELRELYIPNCVDSHVNELQQIITDSTDKITLGIGSRFVVETICLCMPCDDGVKMVDGGISRNRKVMVFEIDEHVTALHGETCRHNNEEAVGRITVETNKRSTGYWGHSGPVEKRYHLPGSGQFGFFSMEINPSDNIKLTTAAHGHLASITTINTNSFRRGTVIVEQIELQTSSLFTPTMSEKACMVSSHSLHYSEQSLIAQNKIDESQLEIIRGIVDRGYPVDLVIQSFIACGCDSQLTYNYLTGVVSSWTN